MSLAVLDVRCAYWAVFLAGLAVEKTVFGVPRQFPLSPFGNGHFPEMVSHIPAPAMIAATVAAIVFVLRRQRSPTRREIGTFALIAGLPTFGVGYLIMTVSLSAILSGGISLWVLLLAFLPGVVVMGFAVPVFSAVAAILVALRRGAD